MLFRSKSDAEHTFDLYLHSEGTLSLEDSKSADQPVAAPVQWIEKLSARIPVAAVSGRWATGGSGIGFWVGGSSPITPITGQCPAETGSRKVELLISRQKGPAAEFVTVLYPCHGKLKLTVERRGNELHIRHGDLLEVLTLPEKSRPELVRRKLGKHSGPGA